MHRGYPSASFRLELTAKRDGYPSANLEPGPARLSVYRRVVQPALRRRRRWAVSVHHHHTRALALDIRTSSETELQLYSTLSKRLTKLGRTEWGAVFVFWRQGVTQCLKDAMHASAMIRGLLPLDSVQFAH